MTPTLHEEAARLAAIIEKDLPRMGELESAWCSVRGYDLRAIHGILRQISAPAAEVPMPEPDITSYQTDAVMRRCELRTFSADQLRAYGDARERAALQAHAVPKK